MKRRGGVREGGMIYAWEIRINKIEKASVRESEECDLRVGAACEEAACCLSLFLNWNDRFEFEFEILELV